MKWPKSSTTLIQSQTPCTTMKIIGGAALTIAALFLSSTAMAADINVRIVNLTNGIWCTPFLVAAHTEDSRIFTAGMPASASLQARQRAAAWPG